MSGVDGVLMHHKPPIKQSILAYLSTLKAYLSVMYDKKKGHGDETRDPSTNETMNKKHLRAKTL